MKKWRTSLEIFVISIGVDVAGNAVVSMLPVVRIFDSVSLNYLSVLDAA
jgi:hypothetical protein